MATDAPSAEPVPTMLVYRCRRQGCTVSVPSDEPEAELRGALDAGRMLVAHRCPDGGLAVAELVGCGPGRAWVSPEMSAEMAATASGRRA